MKSDEGVVPNVVPSGCCCCIRGRNWPAPQWASTLTNSRKTSSKYEWLWRSSR